MKIQRLLDYILEKQDSTISYLQETNFQNKNKDRWKSKEWRHI